MHRKILLAGIALILPALLAAKPRQNEKWAVASKDTLRIELVESGEISAVRSTTISAPHIWNLDMQIIEMVDEGAAVDSGDVLVQIDPSPLLTNLDEEKAQLEIRNADLQKMLVQHRAKISEMEREIEMSQHSLKLAEVQLEQLKFESDSRRDDGELEVLKAKIALKEAQTKLDAQKVIHASEHKKQELLIFEAQGDVDRIQRRVQALTLRAPIDGMAVHHRDWDGTKAQVGGKVRPGSGIINLPDLSRMQVKVRVNEVDMAKLDQRQKATLRLEAFPEKTFTAELVSKTTIADPLEQDSQVRIFEAQLVIAERDSLLKPGMTARVHIILDELPNVVTIPIGCIFEVDGQPVVFEKGSSKPTEITILGRNDFMAAIDGIAEKTEVSWQPSDSKVRPLGYAAYVASLRPSDAERESFFTEMDNRELTFDYEAFRNKPPEPPGGAPGGTKAMLEKLGFPAGEMVIQGGSIKLSPDMMKKLGDGSKGNFEMKIDTSKKVDVKNATKMLSPKADTESPQQN